MLRNKIHHFIFFVCVAAFISSASILGWQYVRGIWEENALKQLAQAKQSSQYSASVSPDTASQTSMEASAPVVLEQYDELSRQNADLIGWIKIDGTKIDYPVMYTGDDFYLHHSFNKASSKSGLPFIDKRCAVEPFGTNTIIYSHNMKNDSMFSGLLKYKSSDYYAEHPIIRFDTLYEEQEYEIVAAFESEVYRKGVTVFKHYNFLNADNQANFDDYIARIKEHSLYDTGIHPEYGDALITLMTCSYHTENGRFVVVARKTDILYPPAIKPGKHKCPESRCQFHPVP